MSAHRHTARTFVQRRNGAERKVQGATPMGAVPHIRHRLRYGPLKRMSLIKGLSSLLNISSTRSMIIALLLGARRETVGTRTKRP